MTEEEGETWGQGDKGKDQYSPPINGFKPPTEEEGGTRRQGDKGKNLGRGPTVGATRCQFDLHLYLSIGLSPCPLVPLSPHLLVLFSDKVHLPCR